MSFIYWAIRSGAVFLTKAGYMAVWSGRMWNRYRMEVPVCRY